MKDFYSKTLIVFFLGMLLLPLRTLAFDPYDIEESFYPRARLIAWTSNLRLALGDRVFPRVIVGDDGWLVYTAEGDIDDYQKVRLFTEEELAQFQQNLDALSANYAERGIELIVVVVPNKNTIYPERVPEQLPVFGAESRLDQLTAYLRQHGSEQLIDLRPALLEAKAEREMYYATDTHWNDYGAYIAYSALLDAAGITPRPPSDFGVATREPDLLDLSDVIGATIFPESKIQFAPLFDLRASYKDLNLGGRKLMFSYVADESLPDLVIYYDSFFFNVIPMLGEHFEHGLYVQNYTGSGLWNLSWVNEREPDVVIIEFAERYLHDLPDFINPSR
jgi:alginate O-acetyltransferase complex protein AlgJ